MRIIGGIHRGRKLKAPKGMQTRPTADRVKEAVFSSLGPKIQGANILDLFGGTGSLSLEALSRGARHAWIIEKDPDTLKVMKENIQTLDFSEHCTLFLQDVRLILKKIGKMDQKFDVIFLDPPYYGKYYNSCLEAISQGDLLSEAGILVLEMAKDVEEKVPSQEGSLIMIKEAAYGGTKIRYYQKVGVGNGDHKSD